MRNAGNHVAGAPATAAGRDRYDLLSLGLFIIVAIVAKAIGCAVFAKLFGFSATGSLRVGIGMIPRGEVELIVAGYGLAAGIIGSDVFSAAVVMVLATTIVAPPLMRLVFPRHAFVPATVEETIAGPPEEGEARA